MVVVMNFRDQVEQLLHWLPSLRRMEDLQLRQHQLRDDYSNHPGYDINTDSIPYDGLGQSEEIGIGPYSCVIFCSGQPSATTTSTATTTASHEDLNGDGAVGLMDVLIVLSNRCRR